jgi:hypothetical protein
MNKLTKTLIDDVLKSKEDIKKALNESIQNTFKDIIKENLSELLEKEDESFDDEEILSKDNEESEVESTEEIEGNDADVSTDTEVDTNLNTDFGDTESFGGEMGDNLEDTESGEVDNLGYGELETIDLTGFDTNQSYDIFMEISDDAIANMVSDDELELIDSKTSKKFIFKKATLEECLLKNKQINEGIEKNDDEDVVEIDVKKDKKSIFGLSGYESTKAFEFNDDLYENTEDESEDVIYEVEIDDESEDVISEEGSEDEVNLEETAFAGSKTFQTGMKQHGKFSTQRSKQVSRNTIGESNKSKSDTLLLNKLEESNKRVSRLVEEKFKLKQIVKDSVNTLNEVSVSYTNLLNATRILHNFSTTKNEKTQILSKFDACKTINESNELFNKLKTKLEKSEKIVTKDVINESKSDSSDKKLIVEKTSYISSDLQNMVGDLMLRMEKKK